MRGRQFALNEALPGANNALRVVATRWTPWMGAVQFIVDNWNELADWVIGVESASKTKQSLEVLLRSETAFWEGRICLGLCQPLVSLIVKGEGKGSFACVCACI